MVSVERFTKPLRRLDSSPAPLLFHLSSFPKSRSMNRTSFASSSARGFVHRSVLVRMMLARSAGCAGGEKGLKAFKSCGVVGDDVFPVFLSMGCKVRT